MSIPPSSEDASADSITVFGDGSASVSLKFDDVGMNNDAYLRIPVKGTVTSATLDVTGEANGQYAYPNFVQVAVPPGHMVYQFGDRYSGPMGYQDRFTTLHTSEELVFDEQGDDSTLKVRLPHGADVTSATMRLTGAIHDGGWANPVKLSEKKGNNYVPLNVGWRPTPQLLDYDGDGDLDMLTGGYVYDGGTRFIFYYENIGTSTSPKWQLDNSKVNIRYNYNYIYSSPTFVDLDDDGDYDIVLAQRDGVLRVFWNTNNNTNPSWSDDGIGSDSVFYGIDEGYYASTDFADMDDDGDLDLAYGVYSQSGSSSNVGVSSYENKYSNGQYVWATASFFGGIDTDRYCKPHLVDYDGDGDFDMFVGLYNGTIGYWENTGSKTSPKWTQDTSVQENIDVGSMSNPATGDLNGDGYLDLIIGANDGNMYYYQKIKSYPHDPAVDVGGDGDDDYTYSGELKSSVTSTDLASEFESHLSGNPTTQDSWGNGFHDVVLKVSSASAGELTLDQLRIEYTYTATSHDFSSALNKYVEEHEDEADEEGYVKVPISVSSRSRGTVKLSGVDIVVDVPPKWSNIPDTYSIDEDTKDLKLIDLHKYVSDDFTALADIKLDVEQLSATGVVAVTITDGRYIGVDAETGTANDNWNGEVRLVAVATDERSQVSESNEFVVKVNPVNDPPVLEGEPPKKVMEDSLLKYQIEARDVDGDKLSFAVISAPSGMKVSETGLVTWSPTNDDVGFYNMTITATDPSGERDTITWFLEVVNVNDPPELDLPGSLTVTEGQPTHVDLREVVSDVDNPMSELAVAIENPFSVIDEDTWVVTILYPKESGIEVDELVVMVKDLEATVTGIITINVIRVERLDLAGIPDQEAVEEDHWTVDIKPYLYNVESFNKLTISTSSSHITVDGTRLNLYYPQDALPSLTETVIVTARQNDEVATDTFVVSLLKLGYDLTLTIIPQQDVVEGEATHLDVTPYIKNFVDLDKVEVLVKGSDQVSVAGKVVTFDYPLYFAEDTETVTVSIKENEFGASRDVTVRIIDGEDDFYLAAIPTVVVTETVPETFNIKTYIKNAYDINYITASVDSPYAEVNRFDIKLVYPEDFTGDDEVAEDTIRITVSDGLHTFTRAVTVEVHQLGKTLQLSGIGDRTVYVDSELVIDVEPYLYNVDDIEDVVLSVNPDNFATVDGLVVTFLYPAIVSFPAQVVTFTADEGSDRATETVTIYIEHIPVAEFVFGPIGSLSVLEDEAFKLDVLPFLKNMAEGVSYEVGVLSDYASVDGFHITFLYDVETVMDETVRVNVTGANGDFAEQDVFVHVNAVNDRPVLVKDIVNLHVEEGEGKVYINLTEHFFDPDTEELAFNASSGRVNIDNETWRAWFEFVLDTPQPDDIVGVVIYAFDPDEPGSLTESNPFNVTFYLKGEDPGPDPGPGPGPGDDINEPSTGGGGGGWALLIIVIGIVAGVGYVAYRKRQGKA